MIFEYIVLCELWNINIYKLNMIYLCFVKLYIKFGIFYITGHGSARSTIGPRAFRAGPARKSAHGPCLGRQADTMAYGGTARWHAGHTGPCPIVPCIARARVVPGRAGPLIIFTVSLQLAQTQKTRNLSDRQVRALPMQKLSWFL